MSASPLQEPGRQLASDQDLLEALGLSPSRAAAAVGRTRQALHQAALASRTDYFRRNDLLALLLAAPRRANAGDLDAVWAYLERTRSADPSLLRDLKALPMRPGDEATLQGYKELWFVLPDLAYLEASLPMSVAQMVRLATRAGKARLFCASAADAASLRTLLPPGRRVGATCVQPWIAGLPYGVIGDPRQAAHYYVLADGRFVRPDGPVGAGLVDLLEGPAPRAPR